MHYLAAFIALTAVCAVSSAAEPALSPRPVRGVDRAYMDTAAAPATDFYGYANGAYSQVPIPGDYANFGVNEEIEDRNQALLKEILETAAKTGGPKSSVAQQVGDFFAAGMDEPAIEHAGLAPMAPLLAQIDAIKTGAEIPSVVGRLLAQGIDTGFSFGVQVDDKDTTAMIAAFQQGGLGLPERDYYFRPDPESVAIRGAYAEHIAPTLQLAGDSPKAAEARATAILGLETKLAEASRTLVDLRDPEKNYNKVGRAALGRLAPKVDWEAFFAQIKFPAHEKAVLVGQPEFFTAFGELTRSVPVETWRAYLRWQVLERTSNYLGRAFVDEHFAFYSRKLSGTPELKPRWKRVLAAADEAIGGNLGQLYVKRAFSPAAKFRALEMVKFHLQAMRGRIQSAQWMSAATKQQAFKKIDAMRTKVGYPDKWRDYRALEVTRGPYVRNVLAAAAFESRRQLAKLGRPVDRSEWFMTPQTCNAYYDRTLNEMCFPAGILQPPFFDETADDASNYGALASTIGHELTHGFDDQGRKYDWAGNLKNWWTDDDARGFQERAEIVARQYDTYEPLPGLHIEGNRTLGEDIADIGGLRISYEAFKLATTGKNLQPVDGLSPDQRFFLAFAQGWRTNQRPEQIRRQLDTDLHSPPRWRVLGPVANFPEFYQAFGCPPPVETPPAIW